MGTSSSKDVQGKPVVLIVGGGYAGVFVAKLLDKNGDFNVVIIDRKNYFLHNIGLLRGCAVEGWEARCTVPYTKVLKYGSIVQGEVESIAEDGKSITVHGYDKPIKCDYMVVCTGSSYAFPCKVAEADKKNVAAKYQALRKSVKEAKSVCVVGGGAVGIELSGEIAYHFPDTQVTLVHSGETLLSSTDHSAKFKQAALTSLQSFKNMKVLLGQKVKNESLDKKALQAGATTFIEGHQTLETTKGNKMEADVTFFCIGTKVNNRSFAKTLTIDAQGRLEVNEFLQVKGLERAFSIGDCASIEGKMGYFAKFQAQNVAKNIHAMEKKKKLTPYKKAEPAMILPTGPKGGCSEIKGLVLGNFLTRNIKSADLFCSVYWGELNQKVNKPQEEATEQRMKKSQLSLEAAMGMTAEEIKAIQEKGLGSEKKVEPGQSNT
uniref:FAD/NAD(P)-binding domain-containing protein n=1 Tax=Lotharella globosa TaxID=91324 RepID=A0A7S3YK60_9EUKA|mmetsp:Transcript_27972/g.54519  ORF Transcript_27972/g.54519 Transcript_27972/m.54519 type:complete len:433 (-) Transcript_27972:181-1479(-)